MDSSDESLLRTVPPPTPAIRIQPFRDTGPPEWNSTTGLPTGPVSRPGEPTSQTSVAWRRKPTTRIKINMTLAAVAAGLTAVAGCTSLSPNVSTPTGAAPGAGAPGADLVGGNRCIHGDSGARRCLDSAGARRCAPVRAGGVLPGDTNGLYGQAGDTASCDTRSLISNLGAEAAEWATALGITSADIPTFVASLSPVLLRADTTVTNHGYTDGELTTYPAVLQAGTAVLVDSHGEPTVKCFSGNPLSKAPDISQAATIGSAWSGYTPQTVTIVQPTPQVVERRTVIDIHNRRPVIRVVQPTPSRTPGPIPTPGSTRNPNRRSTRTSRPSPTNLRWTRPRR